MIRRTIVLAAALAGGAATAGENLLENPGFENGTDGWKRIEAPVWKIVEGNVSPSRSRAQSWKLRE